MCAAAFGLVLGWTGLAHATPATGEVRAAAPSATVSVLSGDGDAVTAAECYYPVYSGDGGAMVCFNPTGEHLYICDNASDGHHPVARYYRSDSSGLKTKHADVGFGTCLDHNLSIPDSGWINYQACNYEGSTQLSCGSFSGRISANG
ncbi:hypothetical protein A8924_5797 [Saccharopolyspora erythraea NRRL 2338]|uniref:Uncharacterized protein n=2 Tax=Saccharopolyspora erythraea TaxID=1836 RepID=A4FKS7_SACEN|nr:hypothetical protein [Saccharopolyspora erythraea]EQD83721.1 hypothetical protein N599_23840 [Saccharopolyspora erythraea D]PFG98291.1 hypothetical protein A8924_5797 [Saccharopolyspora erythraea NRRL 2338]QRK88377.1 hypothetical protein JQX30_27395 [Saccharopolyspora erythraea]CAM04652.1 hypothetical protein SACE_5415 [Saccharopolyspora erythraea NRRL 2338]